MLNLHFLSTSLLMTTPCSILFFWHLRFSLWRLRLLCVSPSLSLAELSDSTTARFPRRRWPLLPTSSSSSGLWELVSPTVDGRGLRVSSQGHPEHCWSWRMHRSWRRSDFQSPYWDYPFLVSLRQNVNFSLECWIHHDLHEASCNLGVQDFKTHLPNTDPTSSKSCIAFRGRPPPTFEWLVADESSPWSLLFGNRVTLAVAQTRACLFIFLLVQTHQTSIWRPKDSLVTVSYWERTPSHNSHFWQKATFSSHTAALGLKFHFVWGRKDLVEVSLHASGMISSLRDGWGKLWESTVPVSAWFVLCLSMAFREISSIQLVKVLAGFSSFFLKKKIDESEFELERKGAVQPIRIFETSRKFWASSRVENNLRCSLLRFHLMPNDIYLSFSFLNDLIMRCCSASWASLPRWKR